MSRSQNINQQKKPVVRVILDDDETISNISSLLKKEKGKKEKKKTPKEEYLISTGKKRVKSKSSIITETANDLIRLGYKTPDKISAYFNTKGRIVDEQQQRLYLLLVKSKVSSGRFVLSDDLANFPFQVYMLCPAFKSKVISNDWLWFALMYKRQIEADSQNAGPLVGKPYIQQLFNNGLVRSVQIVSNSFVCKKDVEKGYYQDYKTNFACIGLDKKKEQDLTDLFQNGIIYKFKYFGYSFIAKGNNGECVIYLDDNDYTAENVINLMKSCKVVCIDENKPKLKEKVIEIKNDVVRYISCTVKPEKFCPAFLRTDEEVRYCFYITATVDYNDVFALLDNSFANTGNISFYENSWYWTNTESWFDFLYVYTITSNCNYTELQKKELLDYCDFYYKYQDIVLAWKKNQLAFQKICYDFYNAFSTKVNYDKAKTLLRRIKDYIDFRNFLTYDESYSKMVTWISNMSFCSFIKNQFKNEIIKIADAMEACLSDLIEKRSSINNLFISFKRVGSLIYYACPNEVQNSAFIPAFPMIFSAGGFLGNLFEKNEVYNVLQDNLIRITNQKSNTQVKTDDIINAIGRVIGNIEKYRREVIGYNLALLANQEGVIFSREELDNLVGEVLKELVKNEAFNNQLNLSIFEALKNNVSLATLVIDQPDFVKNIKQYVLNKKQQVNQAIRNNANIQNQINDLQQQQNQNQAFIDENQFKGGEDLFPNINTNQNVYVPPVNQLPKEMMETDTTGFDERDYTLANKPNSNWRRFKDMADKDNKKGGYLARYYAIIGYLSGVHPEFYNNVNAGNGYTAAELMKKYPILPSTFEIAVIKEALPDANFNAIKKWLDRNPVIKSSGYNYKDTKQVQMDLKDVLGF